MKERRERRRIGRNAGLADAEAAAAAAKPRATVTSRQAALKWFTQGAGHVVPV